MTKRGRKVLWTVIRIGLCLAAMAIVIRGVTLRDSLVLADSGETLVGTIREVDGLYQVESADGTIRSIAADQVARDERGDVQVNYGLVTTLRLADKGLLAVSVAVLMVVAMLQAPRLRWLLAAQQIPLGHFDAVKVSFAGNFLNFTTPFGSHAGDLFKAYFVSLHTERKAEALATIILDRVIGLATMLTVVAVITGFGPPGGRLTPVRPYLLTMLGIGVAAGIVYLTPPLRKVLLPRRLVERLPGMRYVQRMDAAARTLARRPVTVLAAVLITVALQSLAMGAYMLVGLSLGLDIQAADVPECYAYFATGTVIQALPGPPQGLGTVELAYRYFFAPYGGPSQIVCVALAIRLMVLVSSLPGLVVVLTGAYRPRDVREADFEERPAEERAAAPAPPGARTAER